MCFCLLFTRMGKRKPRLEKRKSSNPADVPVSTPGPSAGSLANVLASAMVANPDLRDNILSALDIAPAPLGKRKATPTAPRTSKRRSTAPSTSVITATSSDSDTDSSTVSSVSDPGESLFDVLSSSEEGESDVASPLHDLHLLTSSVAPNCPKKMKHKIWRKDFVNLSTLYFGSDSSNVETHIKKTRESTVTSVKQAPTKKLTSILSWSRAFQLYASIYTLKFPNEGSMLFQYMSLVQTLANSRVDFIQYDEKFRMLQSVSPKPWNVLHTETYLLVTLSNQPQHSSASNNAFRSNSQSTTQRSPFLKPGYCWDFQRSGLCSRSTCSHKHQCSLCNGQHAGSKCFSQRSYNRPYSRPTPPKTQVRRENWNSPPIANSTQTPWLLTGWVWSIEASTPFSGVLPRAFG